MQSINGPKKYIKGEANKLVLNPEYKRWMDTKLKNEDNYNNNPVEDTADNNSTPFAVAVAVAVAVGIESDLPTDPLIHVDSEKFHQSAELELLRSENQRLHELERSENQRKGKEELELLRLENQRLHELEQLKEERDRLEKARKESEDLRLLKEENEKLKRIAKKNRNKKTAASSASSAPKPAPKSSSDTQLFAATVPKHIRPGQTFKVNVKGTDYVVTCPRNAKGGQVIHVPIKIISQRTGPTLYTAKVPMGVRPGMTFKIQAKGKIYNVTCPRGAHGGQTIRVPLR